MSPFRRIYQERNGTIIRRLRQPEAADGQGSRRLPGVRAAGGYSRMSCQASVNGFLRNVAQKKFIE
jgi:hypothetical protein